MIFEFRGKEFTVGKNEVLLAAQAIASNRDVHLQGVIKVEPVGYHYIGRKTDDHYSACLCGIAVLMAVSMGGGMVDENGRIDRLSFSDCHYLEGIIHLFATDFDHHMGEAYGYVRDMVIDNSEDVTEIAKKVLAIHGAGGND